MMMKFTVLVVLIALFHEGMGELYFEKGPMTKRIADIKNETGSFDEEIIREKNTIFGKWWNITQEQLVEYNFTGLTLPQKMIYFYTTGIAGLLNDALRNWFSVRDNTFRYYWITKLLMANVQENKDNVTCYRGERPRSVVNGTIVRWGNYSHGDVIFANQFESCSLNLTITEMYAKDYQGTKGTIYTMRPRYYINATKINQTPWNEELIIAPGDQFFVAEAHHNNDPGEFETLTLDFVNRQ